MIFHIHQHVSFTKEMKTDLPGRTDTDDQDSDRAIEDTLRHQQGILFPMSYWKPWQMVGTFICTRRRRDPLLGVFLTQFWKLNRVNGQLPQGRNAFPPSQVPGRIVRMSWKVCQGKKMHMQNFPTARSILIIQGSSVG